MLVCLNVLLHHYTDALVPVPIPIKVFDPALISTLLFQCSCNNEFDFSDHIVLYIAQYVLPSVIELAYVRVQCIRKDRVKSSASRYVLTIGASLFIILVGLRGMLLTGMFFHTGAESLVAVLIVFLLVIGPVLMFAGSSYFVKALLPGPVDLRDD